MGSERLVTIFLLFCLVRHIPACISDCQALTQKCVPEGLCVENITAVINASIGYAITNEKRGIEHPTINIIWIATDCNSKIQCPEPLLQQTSEESTGVSSPAVAAIACVTFIAGILSTLAVVCTLSARRHKKLCFRVAEEPSPGKWEGASESVTTKVIAKHLTLQDKEIVRDHYDDIGKNTIPCNPDQQYDSASGQQRDSHVYSTLTDNHTNRTEAPSEENKETSAHTYHVLSAHNLYESGRESSESCFASHAFRNSNFIGDGNNGKVDELREDEDVEPKGNNYEAREDNHAEVKQDIHVEIKGDNYVEFKRDNQTEGKENAYFVLEKQ